jgi:hypothetical protein
MGDVVKLVIGRRQRGKKLPKPVLCKECDEPIETARVQLLTGDPIMRPIRCFACQTAWERRFERQMAGVREHQAIEVIR